VRSAAVAALLVTLAAAGPARAAEVTSWSSYGDSLDFITLGRSQVLHPGNTAHLDAVLDPLWREYGAYFDPLGDGDGIYLTIAPPKGQPLRLYNHVGVQRTPFNEDWHAGMDLVSGNRGCNGIFGRYELRQLELAPDGQPTRLWLIYEALCDSDHYASFGEIRVNAQVPEAQRRVAPGIVRWPVLDVWERSTVVPVSYLGSRPLASVALVGAHPRDFTLDRSGCSAGSGPCDVRVRFAPTAGGGRTARLRFTDTSGGVHETTLEGYAYGGTTSADIELPREGRRYHFTSATNQSFFASGWPYDEVEFSLAVSEDFGFGGAFGSARPLAPGHFPNAGVDWRSPAWVRLYYDNWNCEEPGGGEFTLHEFRRMPDETLRSFDVSFTSLCQDTGVPMARGRWRWRAGSHHALPAWLVPGPRGPGGPIVPPPPAASGPSGGSGSPPAGARRRRGSVRVAARWRVGRRATQLRRLVVRGAPRGTSVRIRCRGPRCPFGRRTVRVVGGRARLGRRLTGFRLRAGSVVELRVAGEVFRYVIRRGKPPRKLRLG
jgi:hypothetical protein